MLTGIKRHIRNVFITGLLVTLPIAFTFFILNFLFENLDNALSPAFTKALIYIGIPIKTDFRIPGVGVAMTLFFIFLVGVFATNIFGKQLVSLGERIVEKIPVVRSVYAGTKQVLTTILDADIKAFSQVVLVEFPRKGTYALGLITSETKGEVQAKTEADVLNVFVPTTPNPTSGFLVFVPKEDVVKLSMSVEDGLKFVISGGLLVPPYPPKGKSIDMQSVKNPEFQKDIKV